ncbi:MAG TPA: hypothetical protein VIM69_02035 [Opitutaceae bacterium]
MDNTFGIHGSGPASDTRGPASENGAELSREDQSPDAIPFVRVIKQISSLTALMEQYEGASDKPAAAPAKSADGRGRLVFASTLQQPVQEANGSSDGGVSYQTQLRAIFGVEGDMDVCEILRHAGGLPGISQVERVHPRDVQAVEAAQRQLAAVSLRLGDLTLSVNGSPVEFIREGEVLLAVKTHGQDVTKPYETLRMVAKEVDRLSKIA